MGRGYASRFPFRMGIHGMNFGVFYAKLFIVVVVVVVSHGFFFLCNQSIISWLMLIPDATSFESLLNYFSFFGWLCYGITIFSVLWFRYKRPNDRRPYKVSFSTKIKP